MGTVRKLKKKLKLNQVQVVVTSDPHFIKLHFLNFYFLVVTSSQCQCHSVTQSPLVRHGGILIQADGVLLSRLQASPLERERNRNEIYSTSIVYIRSQK